MTTVFDDAYLDGRRARKEGRHYSQNPHKGLAEIIVGLRWLRGWHDENYETIITLIERGESHARSQSHG